MTGGAIFLGGAISAIAVREGQTIAIIGAILGLGSIVVGRGPALFARTYVCRRCGERHMMIGGELRHCSRCGAPYPPEGE
jgi:hypothetical protein